MVEHIYFGIVGPPENSFIEKKEAIAKHSFLPSSALPNTPKYRRRIRMIIPRTQQIEKTNTLKDRSPALTVNGRF